ncbi:hypothetical protein ACN4EK_29010 [Pantanalinema rosaneae CENA516]|uniref:hypothetical protein n=1 Tax=Pantanalinema rosaneae TaxID=1620701 RepID=UPI003D6F64CD
MCIIDDTPVPIKITVLTEEGESKEDVIHYKIRSVHRRHGNFEKCIWTISPQEEVGCFQVAASEEWLEATEGWGVKINAEGRLEQIGVSEQDEVLKIAKFVDSSSTREWHGYPADFRRRQQDKPSERVLIAWKNRGLINKTKMSKITQRKPCNL